MNEVIQIFANVPTSTSIKLVIGLFGLVASLALFVTRCNNTFEKWRKKKNYKEDQECLIVKSEEQIQQLMESIEKLSEMIKVLREESIERDKIQIRHTIITCCNCAIENKCVDSSELQALEDLYTLYTAEPINGNSYATTLMMKIRKLPIVPKGMASHES